ncbi:hypothetical protein AGDE_12611 [Angomonas deanei]|uniref:Uncharacterized protein n=1 Tax=Angomonas deanei TaxID=59799 RepID=A0A7G2C6G8_9TRYP|nr:hypothetical protein AGDE_12611 [Angomonas deanei]CAD2215075.1 hypothetical protein, conserved [Angomonas deanei]|eukprot:EPY23953.1 hypothetical protein AGDE_12611 [Angomonas deanei]
MNDRGQPLLPAEERNTSNNNSNKTSGLVDQGPSREQLHEYTVSSSKKDLESFLLWWSRVIIRCGLSIHIEGGLGHFLQRYRSLASLLGNNNNNANTVSEGLKKEVSDFLTGKSASYKVQSELAQFFSNNHTNSVNNNNNFYDRCPTFPVAPSVPLFVPFHEMYQHLLDENNNNHNEVNIPNTTNNIFSLFQPYLSSAEKDDEEDSHNNSKNHHHNDNAVYTAARAAEYQMVLPPAAPTLPPASILPTAVLPPSDTTPIAQQLDTYRETVLPTLLGEVHTALEQKGEELLQEIRAQREERFLPFLPPPGR